MEKNRNIKVYDFDDYYNDRINQKVFDMVCDCISNKLEGSTYAKFYYDNFINDLVNNPDVTENGIIYNVVDMKYAKQKYYFDKLKEYWKKKYNSISFDNCIIGMIHENNNYELNNINIDSQNDNILIQIGYPREKENEVDKEIVFNTIKKKKILSRF